MLGEGPALCRLLTRWGPTHHRIVMLLSPKRPSFFLLGTGLLVGVGFVKSFLPDSCLTTTQRRGAQTCAQKGAWPLQWEPSRSNSGRAHYESLFWLIVVFLEWNPGDTLAILVWVAVRGLVSTLTDEIGHALCARKFGHLPTSCFIASVD